jgi:hypothetical protein
MRTHLIHRAMAALIIVLGLALGSASATAAGRGDLCGGILPIVCDKGLWCQNPSGQCKVINGPGKCEVVPRACPRNFRPVCGCNGKTYPNDCERQRARSQLDHFGRCEKKY